VGVAAQAGSDPIRHCEPTGRRDAPPDAQAQNREKELDCFVASLFEDTERQVVKSRA
jgi:hypothetical protein